MPTVDMSMEKCGAEPLYCSEMGMIHAIWTKDEKVQNNPEYLTIQIAKPQTIERWYQSTVNN